VFPQYPCQTNVTFNHPSIGPYSLSFFPVRWSLILLHNLQHLYMENHHLDIDITSPRVSFEPSNPQFIIFASFSFFFHFFCFLLFVSSFCFLFLFPHFRCFRPKFPASATLSTQNSNHFSVSRSLHCPNIV